MTEVVIIRDVIYMRLGSRTQSLDIGIVAA
jgi:hypothetical protein